MSEKNRPEPQGDLNSHVELSPQQTGSTRLLRGWCSSVRPIEFVRIVVIGCFAKRVYHSACDYKEGRADFSIPFHLRRAWNLVRVEAFIDKNWRCINWFFAWRPLVNPPKPKPVVKTARQEPWPADCPLVSFVIPCYNYGRFIDESLKAVLAQTFKNFEIIIVDGGSGPETVNILKSLRNPRVQVLFREGRHLVGDNRNYGIERAKGKYICCPDPDDKLLPTYIEKALFFLEHENYDIVSCWQKCFGQRDDLCPVERRPSLLLMLEANHIKVVALFRKTFWEQAGGFHDFGLGKDLIYEDWNFWIRLMGLGARPINICEPLLLYRVHQTSLSNMAAIPPMPVQGAAIRKYNADVLTEENFRRAKELERTVFRVENSLVNLHEMKAKTGPVILVALTSLIMGGLEKLISQICRHLSTQGFRIMVVTTFAPKKELGDSTPWFEDFTSEIYHLPNFLDQDEWNAFIFYLVECKKVDAVWQAGSEFFYPLIPELKQKYPQTKIVDFLYNTAWFTKHNRQYAGLIDFTIAENEEVEQWLLNNGETAARLRLIKNGVDLTRFQPTPKPADLLAELKIPQDGFVVGFAGRLSPEKGPDLFLQMANRLRDQPKIYFVMLGAGPMMAEIKTQSQQLALDRFHFLGPVENVARYMALFDVSILPSRIDGRPNSVLESLAMGVPVIASKVGALPEIISPGENGFLCSSGDVEDFSAQIQRMAENPAGREKMKTNARVFAEKKLDIRASFEAYESLFRDLCGKQS